jgi:hypothetical protein
MSIFGLPMMLLPLGMVYFPNKLIVTVVSICVIASFAATIAKGERLNRRSPDKVNPAS